MTNNVYRALLISSHKINFFIYEFCVQFLILFAVNIFKTWMHIYYLTWQLWRFCLVRNGSCSLEFLSDAFIL